jgi:hypothetical protein
MLRIRIIATTAIAITATAEQIPIINFLLTGFLGGIIPFIGIPFIGIPFIGCCIGIPFTGCCIGGTGGTAPFTGAALLAGAGLAAGPLAGAGLAPPTGAPHLLQNFVPSGIWAPHLLQNILILQKNLFHCLIYSLCGKYIIIFTHD